MPAVKEVFYRLRLVLGFLEEARQDFNLGRWRSCVDNQSDKRESMNLQKRCNPYRNYCSAP